MTNPNDSAYPEIITELEDNGLQNTYSYGGLTKREHFAAMFMQSILAYSKNDIQETARNSIRAADALMEQLNKIKTDIQ